MFRLVLSAFLFLNVLCTAFADNTVVMIYRNDGMVSAFLKSDIDSIRYSHLDLDSLEHRDFVTQEVFMPDTVCRIPISAIDSVSFVCPPTVYRDDATPITAEQASYVTGVDGLEIIFRTNTPESVLPRVGQRIVTVDYDEVFPEGFAGKVASIEHKEEGIVVSCSDVLLEDVFDSFCSIATLQMYSDGNQTKAVRRSAMRKGSATIPLPPIEFSPTFEAITSGDLALRGGVSAKLGLSPVFRVSAFAMYSKAFGYSASCVLIGDMNFYAGLKLYGGIKFSRDKGKEVASYGIAKCVNFYLKPGFTYEVSATTSVELSCVQPYRISLSYEYSSIGQSVLKPVAAIRALPLVSDVTGCIEGQAKVGCFMEVGFNLLHSNLTSVHMRGEFGFSLTGTYVLTNSDVREAKEDAKLYERLKASSLAIDFYVEAKPEANFLDNKIVTGYPLSFSQALWKRDLVPTFSYVDFTRNGGMSAVASASMTGNCIAPVGIGFKVKDAKGDVVEDVMTKTVFDNGEKMARYTFGNLPSGKLELYPVVNLFGFDILAAPTATLEMECPAKITDFKQTASEKSNGGFNYNGSKYKYKFEVATTVECSSDNEDIADWGYAYEDPNGSIAHISLSKYTSPYTDTRYVYYRNEPNSTARLYGYVKYAGDTEYVYDEPHDYPLKHSTHTCPDDHHPHLIDLGLPSGTKWACCNIGASMPSDYGGKYAWGETEEKYDYSASNYKFAQASKDGWMTIDGVHYIFIYIGESICGTSYDVANVKWGNSWRMPTVTEMEELVSQCLWELDIQDGSYVYKVTGPNEASIVLPGYYLQYWTGNLNHEASNWFGKFAPIPYVLWSDPSPHVHSPIGTSNHLGSFTAAYQGIYVRAVSDSNINSTRKMVSKLNSEVEQVAKGTDNNITVVVKEKTENTKYGTRTFCELNNK